MLGRAGALDILKAAIEAADADMAQASIRIGEFGLTRFANSSIHQNVLEKNAELAVKVIAGKRIGYAATNRLDEKSICGIAKKAAEFARHSQENPDFTSLPHAKPIKDANTFDGHTAFYTPEERAEDVSGMVCEAERFGAKAAGAISTGYQEFAIMNSLGVEAYNIRSQANLSTVMTAESGFGYADRASINVMDLNPVPAAAEAAARSCESRNPISVEPGEYDVILMPYAVAEFLDFLAYTGLGARSVQEGRSFMSGKFGQQITGKNITIWDDGLNSAGLPIPFDSEGVPKQHVQMIVDGVAKGVVYDSYTAHKEGKESTGHAAPGGDEESAEPMPINMFMAPGDATVPEMIAETKKGILVTRFHYTNVIHPILTIITGMTRDGTFLVEDGKVTKPVKNLRFTDSILERLNHVDMISREPKRQSICVVPAIRARRFRFTGTTEF